MRAFRILIALAILISLAPLISMGVAEAIASWHGCELAVEAVKPCMANGEDIGQTLHTLVFMGYFLYVTLPATAGLVALWVLVEVVRWMRR